MVILMWTHEDKAAEALRTAASLLLGLRVAPKMVVGELQLGLPGKAAS